MPSLNKPSAGDTDWTTEINDNWTALQNQLTNAFQGRLQKDSATQVSLQRYGGDVVEVNGKNVAIGVDTLLLLTSDNLITSTGADAGSAMAVSTLYYVYVSNADASPFPSDLRASTTAPSSYNGVKYLGTSGNAANWRFVGYVRTNGSTQFVDSESQRFVINYYNRRALSLVSPAETTDQWTYTPGTPPEWRQANNNTSNKVEFISNGEDLITAYLLYSSKVASASGGWCGIGIDRTNGSDSKLFQSQIGSSSHQSPQTSIYHGVPSEGYHYLSWNEHVNSGSVTFYGDRAFSDDDYKQQEGLVAVVYG